MQNLSQKHFSPLHTKHSIALVANGAMHDYSLMAPMIQKYDRCVAVDGGLAHCHAMEIRPELILGDFDSIPQQLLKMYPEIPKQDYPSEKDQTDLELALRLVDNPSIAKIGIFGALEKRTDHALANLYLMRRYAGKVVIETETETVFMISGQHRIECSPGQTLSLMPIGASATGVTTQGLKWEVHEATFDANFMSISNVCLGPNFSIHIGRGELLCCLLRV